MQQNIWSQRFVCEADFYSVLNSTLMWLHIDDIFSVHVFLSLFLYL